MLTSMTTGTGPDVFDMNDDNVRGDYIPRHLLAPVDTAALGYSSNAQLKAAYQPGALGGAAGTDGKVYGVRWNWTQPAWRSTRPCSRSPDSTRLTTRRPGTRWAPWARRSPRRPAPGLQHGLPARLGPTAAGGLPAADGGRVIGSDGKTSVINQAGGVQALEIWNKLVNVDHAGNAHTATRNSTVPYYDFSAGKQGMTIFFPWAVTQVQQQYPKMLDQMQIVPLPQVSPGTSHRFDYGYSWVVSAASSSDKQQAAWKFVGHLAAQHSQYLSGSGQVQPVTNWQESPAGKKMPFSSAW